ncbi:uncharacterized protein LOC131941754 isoform X2 [Physella acuta]|uniref:uncharacterized protein LOC131941754 isoform X2 n=1 Tax=Physella acuta TaxID=109671 RepID=UPI0027DBB4D3|nr:uncharacterized protein LOC131941754 isoform X2 [Physella acuta]
MAPKFTQTKLQTFFFSGRYAHPSTVQVQQRQENCEIENLRGSIYFRVDCAKCCEPVGMILKNLPVHLSLLEGNLSFYIDKVTSCAIPGKSQMPNQTLFSAVMKMQEEISKIQVVILNIHQRLENIEKTFAEEDENLNAEEIKHI